MKPYLSLNWESEIHYTDRNEQRNTSHMEYTTPFRMGIDIGSTTIKIVVLDSEDNLVYHTYARHFSKPLEALKKELEALKSSLPENAQLSLAFSGSAALTLAEKFNALFVQEVYATKIAAAKYLPETDIIIELGGEDAKILFLSGGLEVRMNGSCAGGTGAFIDQMATLLKMTPDELNEKAAQHTRIYTIASRCGVFAKSDVQPLLNQGAQKEDIAASIFKSVVNQTIAGLAQGRPLKGNIAYLGGPLTFLDQLRKSFDETLDTHGVCPENSLYFVALGAALSAGEEQSVSLEELTEQANTIEPEEHFASLPQLFKDEEEYQEFVEAHKNSLLRAEPGTKPVNAYLGIDAGSTTIKMVVIDEDGRIVFDRYAPNEGSPLVLVRKFLLEFYEQFPGVTITGSASTGYGEDLIKEGFKLDFGLVETQAHLRAAQAFSPDVDFVIDIGGQDIKCFKIVDGVLDDLFLNEACSSGCGSFLQSFAEVLGYSLPDFARLGLFAKHPVDLGSRCTVFMNSSVKEAQKNGASVEDIAAGLCVSVVKNALYKVIRATSPEALGKHIVVQGGTFLNDAVLRAFEQEIKRPVTRPEIAGLMGAYGAALYARDSIGAKDSTTLDEQAVRDFSHTVRSVTCRLCTNHCSLTINKFSDGTKYIGGNRCDKPIKQNKQSEEYNLYKYKQDLLSELRTNNPRKKRGTVGLPLALNMFEMLPYWNAFFTALGYQIVVSPFASHELYEEGQHTIPSDTACYPAKMVHGHIEWLLKQDVDFIFYPCMTYNFDEGLGDNHYNCPVVAYYPEVVESNIPAIKESDFFYPYIGVHRPRDLAKKLTSAFNKHGINVSFVEVKHAIHNAMKAREEFLDKVREKALEYIQAARSHDMPIIVLAGRPYHLDPEINHGVDNLIVSQGAAVITEDSISHFVEPFKVNVLNQWTYHSRLYAAARYVSTQHDMQLVQLVSFGCGVDAIVADEVRSILRAGDKIYTQIKIDEISNLGAITIRLRSLFAAISKERP